MATKNLHFETLQVHVGQEQADPATDARAVPIYQTTSYVFHNSAHAAARFGLQDPGNIYGRLTNSTQGVFEQRVAALEGGVAGLAVASGAAAITYAFENITRAGDHIVAAKTIYGGSYNLLAHTLPSYGITTTFVDPSDLSNFEKAIQENTKAVFIETLGNPNSNIIDIEAVAEIAHRHKIPNPPYRTRSRYRSTFCNKIHWRTRFFIRRSHCRFGQIRLGSFRQISTTNRT